VGSVLVSIITAEQPEIGIMFKTAAIVELVFEVALLIACGVAWAAAGFPRLAEVAVLGGLGLTCLFELCSLRN